MDTKYIIDKNRKITLSKAAQEKLGLKPKDSIIFESTDNNTVCIKKEINP